MCLAYAGKARASIREIETAQAALQGIERARAEVFRISVYWLAGRGGGRGRRRDIGAPRLAKPARLRLGGASPLQPSRRPHAARPSRPGQSGPRTRAGHLHGAGTRRRRRRCPHRARHVFAPQDRDDSGCWPKSTGVVISTLSSGWPALSNPCRADALVGSPLSPEAGEDLARFEERSRNAEAVDSLNQARLDGALLALASGDSATAAAMATSARPFFRSAWADDLQFPGDAHRPRRRLTGSIRVFFGAPSGIEGGTTSRG